MKEQKIYSIKGAAKEAGPVSPSTMRNLDKILQPLRTETGQRIYTQQHVDIARVVLHPKKP